MDPLRRGSRSWADAERRLQQIQTVLRPGEGQPPAQLARPVEKIPALGGGQFFLLAAKAVFCYNIPVFHRDRPPDQHRAGLPLRLSDHIEAVVHPIDQIEISGPGAGEQSLRPGGPLVLIGVARLVHPANVRLRLRDAAHQPPLSGLPDQVLSQQVPGHRQGIPVIKASGQRPHGPSPLSDRVLLSPGLGRTGATGIIPHIPSRRNPRGRVRRRRAALDRT